MKNIKKIVFILFIIIIQNNIYAQVIDCIDSTKIDSSNIKHACLDLSRFIDDASFRPVCGCDSVTYITSYCSYFHGITEYQEAPCSCIEKSFIDTTLSLVDLLGELHYGYTLPVKGCDGHYYPTPEMAVRYGGVTSFTFDSIPCQVNEFIDTSLDLSIFKDRPVCGCDKKQYRNKYEAFFYGGIISWKNYECKCIDEAEIDTNFICSEDSIPVCGCDRVTYQNKCIAENYYGVQYTFPGECPCIDSSLILNDSVLHADNNNLIFYKYIPICGCDSITYFNSVVAQYYFGVAHWTDEPCKCRDTSKINLEANCSDIYDPVLGCDGVLYKNSCVARYYYGILKVSPAPCKYINQIDSTIDCNPHFNYDPVCGCDTVTYPNECYAKYHIGLTKWYYGPCLNDSNCIDTFLIDTLKYCSDNYDPVCGCDSITYTNECVAKYRYGLKKWDKGRCTTNTKEILSSNKSFVIVYPNPFKDKINFLFSIDHLPENIKIYDMLGNIVMNKTIINKSINQTILIKNSPNGIYMYCVTDVKGKIHMGKLILNSK